jgi:hypothetical protein
MDVRIIGCLCISLHNSTVQLHNSKHRGMFRGWSSQSKLVGCTTEEQHSVVCLLWAKRLNAKDIHKEIFPNYSGKCLSCKAVHDGVEKFSQRRLKVADDGWPGVEVAEITVKTHLCCGFQCTGKAMGQVYRGWWRICQKINVFSRFKYHMFHNHLWPTYWLSLIF